MSVHPLMAGTRSRVPGWPLAVILWAGSPVYAQPSGQVAGTVTDLTGAALADVAITVQGAGNHVAYTGQDGSFEFLTLPEGNYELITALAGFAPVHRTFRLERAGRVTFSLTLAAAILEQIVVTASKTGERDVQAIPMAVSVLSENEVQRGQARTVEDLAGHAPSVTFSQNTGFAQLTIRGIGTNVVFAGSDPSSAVYVDGVYMARPAMVLADFVDLERAEVLRGPQGTLYGRNAVGGALNLVTKSPTNEVEALRPRDRWRLWDVSGQRASERPDRCGKGDGQRRLPPRDWARFCPRSGP